jgi:predicted SAM-dependent methyltransferase
VKLDLGSGDAPCEGYTTVDYYNPAADIDAPLWDLPYADGTAEEIRCFHALEHVPAARVAPTLLEWWRVLAPGRRLRVEVPDLDWVCRRWLENPDTDGLNYIFGNQADEGQFHQTGFVEKTLRAALSEAGFIEISIESVWSHAAECLRAEGWKR